MNARRWFAQALVLGVMAPASPALARALSVEVWTDRGHEAVYQDGELLEIKARASDDSYLLIYEIDSEGHVHLLFPDGRRSGFVEGDRTYRLPGPDSDVELVVHGPVGEGYIVAIVSSDPFRELPWYLRPYNAQAEEMGYQGGPASGEEGVTAEGKIVGDPFVAMERIRRQVLENPNDVHSFATAYTTYYVHHEVRYPRYLCNDCHRPERWAWWDGFDPYYTHCRVFDFRVNWSWGWGPSYWYGQVPYYVFVYRPDCPPRYRPFYSRRICYSSWDGWRRWRTAWGAPLTRYKSAPPPGYVPPKKYDPARRWPKPGFTPPGYLTRGSRALGSPRTEPVAQGLEIRERVREPRGLRGRPFEIRGRDFDRPSVDPGPGGRERLRRMTSPEASPGGDRPPREIEPARPVRGGGMPRIERPRTPVEVPREARRAPRDITVPESGRRHQEPAPRAESPREERKRDVPRVERVRPERPRLERRRGE